MSLRCVVLRRRAGGECEAHGLHQQLSELTDPRAERWWQLVAPVQPPATAPSRDPATVTWLHEALGTATEL